MEAVGKLYLQSIGRVSFTIKYCEPSQKGKSSYFSVENKSPLRHHEWIADALRHFKEKSNDITSTIYIYQSIKGRNITARVLILGDSRVQEHLVQYFQDLHSNFEEFKHISGFETYNLELSEHDVSAPYGSPTFHIQVGDYFYRHNKEWFHVGLLRSNASHKDALKELIDKIELDDFDFEIDEDSI